MRRIALLVGIVTFCAVNVRAQSNLPLVASLQPAAESTEVNGSNPSLFAAANDGSGSTVHDAALAVTLPNAASAQEQPPVVLTVFQRYPFQIYGGYTFMRFYQVPGLTKSLNGFNMSVQYFIKNGPLALDGEFVATFGSEFKQTQKFAAGLGGARYRYQLPRGVQVWGHGLIGGGVALPQTAFGGQDALTYEVGGGADFGSESRRWALRVSADMLGTRFYGVNQYSPKLAAGIVYKF